MNMVEVLYKYIEFINEKNKTIRESAAAFIETKDINSIDIDDFVYDVKNCECATAVALHIIDDILDKKLYKKGKEFTRIMINKRILKKFMKNDINKYYNGCNSLKKIG